MTLSLDFDIKDTNIIVWRGQVVMSRSEAPYFEMLFARVAKHMHVSRILEIGFGLGISANLIQRYLIPVEHHIVEIDQAIGADLIKFAGQHASVMPIIGDWTSTELDAPYDFVFFDPFDYFEKTENDSKNDIQLLHDLVGESGVLCHPHFGDGEPRQLIGFRNVILERLEVPRITMADGTHCEHCAVVLCYPTN